MVPAIGGVRPMGVATARTGGVFRCGIKLNQIGALVSRTVGVMRCWKADRAGGFASATSYSDSTRGALRPSARESVRDDRFRL